MFFENIVCVKILQSRLHQTHDHEGMKRLIAAIHSFILCTVM